MFKRKTLFVVGAGASTDFGLPIGRALMDRIRASCVFQFDHVQSLSKGDQLLLQIIHGKYSLGERINTLMRSARKIFNGIHLSSSIDNFIDLHREDESVAELGKLLIAYHISKAEAASSLKLPWKNVNERLDFSADQLSNSWIDRFARIAIEGVPRYNVGQIFENVSIICFNYDRCIEQYLTFAIASTYDISLKDASGIVSSLNIIHPYGTLGPLAPNPQSIEGNSVPYGYTRQDGADVWAMSERIKTYTERIEDDAALKRLRETMYTAQTIVFLGFGFHPQNMNLLKTELSSEHRTRRVYVTGRGIHPRQFDEITNRINELFQSTQGNSTFVNIEIDTTSTELLDVYRPQISAR